MPHGIGASDESLRGRRRDRAPAREHLVKRRERPPAGLRRGGKVPGRSALARLPFVLRVLSRRQRRRSRRQPSDRLDRHRRANPASIRGPSRRDDSRRRQDILCRDDRSETAEARRARSAEISGRKNSGASMNTVRYPSLYQINTRVWLTELSRQLGRPARLDDIPDAELDRIAAKGFDWVWLLSVWQTGAAAQRVSRGHAEWREEFQHTLPDLREEDIAGSG